MKTASFNSFGLPVGNGVAITNAVPPMPRGKKPNKLISLAPHESIEFAFKSGEMSFSQYQAAYENTVLSRLDAEQVVQRMYAMTNGCQPVLLDWEHDRKKTHSVFVAEWLKRELGICISAYKKGESLDAPPFGRDVSEIKVLTLKFPWSWLLLSGEISSIFMSYPTAYRGLLLIHNAQSICDQGIEFAESIGCVLPSAPINGIIGCAQLYDSRVNSFSNDRQGKFTSGFQKNQWRFRFPYFCEPYEIHGDVKIWDDPKIPKRELVNGYRCAA